MDENTKKFHKGSSTNHLNRILVFFVWANTHQKEFFLTLPSEDYR